ncbi:uncharacterized protein LOC124943965 [Impatiens glandulifera]|uniref:uncharacterized protein LOC124943965 n=1 Tax=Impatiens glandulifera TaxID=253017 RepID=UPI001FB0703B|nr:uncharacterized protein LOC124943965 [Impatiens glandulifera]
MHSFPGPQTFEAYLEVVNDLVSSYGSIIVTSTDNHGNRALSVAAYRGHLAVVQALISHSELYHQNNYGGTFLHMAVAGFTSPGFRRLDHQMNLMKHLITNVMSATIIISESDDQDTGHLINVRNNEGRTALHCALALNNNIPCEVLHLLILMISAASGGEINNNNYNSQEEEDHFKARTRHLRSQSLLLLQQYHQPHDDVAAGADNNNTSKILVMNSRSPGASFRISDADILFYASPSSQSPLISRVSNNSSPRSFVNPKSTSLNYNNNTATRLKILLRWPKKKNIKDLSYHDDDDSLILSSSPKLESSPTPLRH